MKKVLIFFLGMLLGIIFVFGALAGGIYIAVTVVKPKDIAPETSNFLGDLANMSLWDMAKNLSDLYKNKIGVADENGRYYSLGEFLAEYKIDSKTAFGMDLPEEVLDIPAFEFFNSSDGVNNAMKQIKVSALPAIVNMFGSKGENENADAAFNAATIEELSNYSLYELLKDESKGIAYVFQNVKFADVLKDSFPSEDSDNKLMWAVGQAYVGKLLSGMSGENNILGQLKTGGAFEALGKLPVIQIIGESQYVKAILGDILTADLVDENGNMNFDGIINGISLGELLGCQKNPIIDLTGYVEFVNGNDVNAAVKRKAENEKEIYAKTSDGENWFEAELSCDKEEHIHSADCGVLDAYDCGKEEHTHGVHCFGFVWYSTAECSDSHEYHLDEMEKDDRFYPRVTGMYSVLANLTMSDLTSGDSNALYDKIKLLKISDLLEGMETGDLIKNVSDMTIGELMSGGFEKLYLGLVFGYKRNTVETPAGTAAELYSKDDEAQSKIVFYMVEDGERIYISDDNKIWYEGTKVCDNINCEHKFSECYGFKWYATDNNEATGVQSLLASYAIEDIPSINSIIKDLTLDKVLDEVPDMLDDIRHEPIGNLQNAINKLYLGGFLKYKRKPVDKNLITGEIAVLQDGGEIEGYIFDLNNGKFALSDDESSWYEASLDCNDSHPHNRGCYRYDWYEDTSYTTKACGVAGKLADKKVNELNALNGEIEKFTLSDVLSEVPSMLKSIKDKPIGELSDAINNMYLGDFLEYEKTAGGWIDSNGREVTGIMAKLADKRVTELKNLDGTVKTFTIKDILGNDVPDMLKDIENTEIGNLQNVIDDIYLGSAMGYARKEITDLTAFTDVCTETVTNANGVSAIISVKTDGSVYVKSENGQNWYVAEHTADDCDGHHDTKCYKYVWYTDETFGVQVAGIPKAFVNSKLNNVQDTMNSLTIKELGIDTGQNNLLKALENTKLTELGGAANDIKMGVVLGYTRGNKINEDLTCGNSNHTHTESCYDYLWHSGEVTSEENTVKGLNAKVSNMTIGGMAGGNGLADIAANLTVGDLLESDMMALEEDERYKLNILFCKDSDLTYEGTITITTDVLGTPQSISQSKTYKCTITDYLTFIAQPANADKTPRYYYELFNDGETDKNHADGCLGCWENMKLKDFVSELLDALK